MRSTALALFFSGAAAHTNLVGFDAAPTTATIWTYCAGEDGYCECPAGKTKYGYGNQWATKDGSQSCSNSAFEDPWPYQVKHCECGVPGPSGVKVSVFFGTYHRSATGSGAIALYSCREKQWWQVWTTSADCTTEAYGRNAAVNVETPMTVSLTNPPNGAINWVKTTQGSWSVDELHRSGFRTGSTLFHDIEKSSVYNIQMGTIDAIIPCDGTTYLVDYDNDPTTTVAKSRLSATWSPCYSGCGSFTMSDIFITVADGCGLSVEGVESDAVAVTGDPHLMLPHGGRADFRGEDKAYYNFLSAKNIALNVMTEAADFELHEADSPKHKDVHGSFITQAHIVARTNESKLLRLSVWASKIGPTNIGWANGTIDDGPAFTLCKFVNPNLEYVEKNIDDINLKMAYSTLVVSTPEFVISITPLKFRKERNVYGLHHRLDTSINLRVPEAALALAPHGIIGQAWDGDGKAIDGEKDAWPTSGPFTTYAMAQGAIEGTHSDYKLAGPYVTDFKFSRFSAASAAPRDVAKLVAAGVLNTPKTVENVPDTVGSTEYNHTDV